MLMMLTIMMVRMMNEGYHLVVTTLVIAHRCSIFLCSLEDNLVVQPTTLMVKVHQFHPSPSFISAVFSSQSGVTAGQFTSLAEKEA